MMVPCAALVAQVSNDNILFGFGFNPLSCFSLSFVHSDSEDKCNKTNFTNVYKC